MRGSRGTILVLCTMMNCLVSLNRFIARITRQECLPPVWILTRVRFSLRDIDKSERRRVGGFDVNTMQVYISRVT